MAAKQGTLAQLSAQAEETKRAMFSKAGWFSNLNTVCTIKSAPPRSPEVLQMLAVKSGWLYKRNEQHVWQARWCCVVPHMFLYYFDAPSVSSSSGGTTGSNNCHYSIPNPTSQQQEDWNKAVRIGLGSRHEKRTHFPFMHHHSAPSTDPESSASAAAAAASAEMSNEEIKSTNNNAQPAGIIDLECYTTIHRSAANPSVIELAGDDQVNPDLRAFYFCSNSSGEDDIEEWNSALINNRHSALTDEIDAYKQVADGFAQQLQMLHSELDAATQRQEESEQELYRVRSSTEETRRTVYRLLEDCAEGAVTAVNNDTTDDAAANKQRIEDFRRHAETVRTQDMGVTAAVRVMVDYVHQLEEQCKQLRTTNETLYKQTQDCTDQAEIQELQKATLLAKEQHETEKQELLQQLAAAQASSQAATKELQDVQKDLSSTKMEVTMLMSQQRNKMTTMNQHKKILKKEVIDLRQKMDDMVSEHSTLQHEYDKMKLQLEQERSKNDLLSRYVDKMESQVQVQQNMMEMMSTAGGSVYGGGGSVIHHHNNNNTTSNRSVGSNTPNRRNRRIEEDFENDERMLMQPPVLANNSNHRQQHNNNNNNDHNGIIMNNRIHHPKPPTSRTPRGGYNDDVDNKSHVSELTEDRTQREFAAYQAQFSSPYADSKRTMSSEARQRKRIQEQQLSLSPRRGPPSVIIGVKKVEDDHITEDIIDDDEDVVDDSQKCNDVEINDDRDMNSNTIKKPPIRGLDTIVGVGSVRSLPIGTPPIAQRRSIPPSYQRDASSVSEGEVKKLSVAQRARLEADKHSTPVNARLDEKSLSSLQKRRSNSSGNLVALTSASLDKASPPNQPTTHQQQQQPPVQNLNMHQPPKHISPNKSSSGLWRRMEEAVLGPRSDDDDESYRSSDSAPITDLTDDMDDNNKQRENAKRRFSIRQHSDEKKTPEADITTSLATANLSLQERSQLQRNMQLQFLKEQGLIKKDTDIKGGAGAITETASVTSSTASPISRSLSFSVATGRNNNNNNISNSSQQSVTTTKTTPNRL